MEKKNWKKEIFTIPNFLTLLRIVAIPFFMYYTLKVSTYTLVSETYPEGFPLIAFIIMASAAFTDLFDGWIARTFNQGSTVGMMIDPLADKLMHITAVLSLTIVGLLHWVFVAMFVFKEVMMLVGSSYLVSQKIVIQANIWGKIAAFIISIGVFMCYFHSFWALKVFYLDWIVMGIGLLFTYWAFFQYYIQGYKAVIEKKTNKNKDKDELKVYLRDK